MQTRPRPITLDFADAGNGSDHRCELSSVVQVGQDLWLGSDEGATLERLSPTKRRTYGHHRSFELADYIDLPDPTEEIDIEGLAYAAGYTGLGVGATRFGAQVMLDLLSGEQTELTRLRMVRTKPVPFGRYGSGEGNQDEPLRDVVAIYGNLPEPEPPNELEQRLNDLHDKGEWERVKARKQDARA